MEKRPLSMLKSYQFCLSPENSNYTKKILANYTEMCNSHDIQRFKQNLCFLVSIPKNETSVLFLLLAFFGLCIQEYLDVMV